MAGKFIAFLVTNSVGILTDALESIVNVVAGFISLYSIRLAAKPKDTEHPFGHGKIELISASLEGLLIMGAGLWIIYEGIRRFFMPAEIAQLDIGILIVASAGAINYTAGWYSIRIGKRYDSIALIAGGKHLQSDTYSSIGLVLGLVLLYITKLHWIDSALALIFGSVIVVTGISILRKTIANLLDTADQAVLDKMVTVIVRDRQPDWIDVHNLKTIKYGNSLFIDCDLTLPWYYNVRESHTVCEALQHTLSVEFSSRVLISIHADPCKPEQCTHCTVESCPHRSAPFTCPLPLTLQAITESDEDRNE